MKLPMNFLNLHESWLQIINRIWMCHIGKPCKSTFDGKIHTKKLSKRKGTPESGQDGNSGKRIGRD